MEQPTTEQQPTERQILTRRERAAVARFRAVYGLEEGDRWSDTVLEQALADYHLPRLRTLPTADRGPYDNSSLLAGALCDIGQARAWQRVNAMHLLAHAIINNRARCSTCEGWGAVEGGALTRATAGEG